VKGAHRHQVGGGNRAFAQLDGRRRAHRVARAPRQLPRRRDVRPRRSTGQAHLVNPPRRTKTRPSLTRTGVLKAVFRSRRREAQPAAQR
jgi:hypothetical protein